MTDQELDEILNIWQAPDVPSTLRPRTISRFAPKEKPPIFRRTLIAIAVAAALLLAVQAIPQTFIPAGPPPYTVRSAYDRYTSAGMHKTQIFTESYLDARGSEVFEARWLLGGNKLDAALRRALDIMRIRAIRLVAQVTQHSEAPDVQLAVGCADDSCLVMETVGLRGVRPASGCAVDASHGLAGQPQNETMLGYPTTAIRFPVSGGHERQKWAVAWLAPGLGCFPLKISIEQQQPDGSFQLTWVRSAIKVTVNR
jgi:hypothetical protein